MFEKFGEFDSYKELNKTAEGLKKEGDMDSLKLLAQENGLFQENCEDYVEGYTDELCNSLEASMGRLQVEEEDCKLFEGVKQVIYTMAKEMCSDESEEFREAVTKKGKRLEKIMDAMREHARSNAKGNVGVAAGTDRKLKSIIRAYYMGSEADLKKAVAE